MLNLVMVILHVARLLYFYKALFITCSMSTHIYVSLVLPDPLFHFLCGGRKTGKNSLAMQDDVYGRLCSPATCKSWM